LITIIGFVCVILLHLYYTSSRNPETRPKPTLKSFLWPTWATSDPPPPLDQIQNETISTVSNLVGDTFLKIANKDPRIRFIKTVENNGNIRLRFVDNKFFEGEAVVLLGQLWDRSWG